MYAKLKGYLVFHKNGFEGLKMIHHVDASAIPVTLLQALTKALYPYIGLYFVAYIIDGLIKGAFKKTLVMVGILLLSNFIVGVLQDILEKVHEYKSGRVGYLTELEVRKKALEIDFETLEDAKTLEQVNSAVHSLQHRGGFGILLENYCRLFEGAFSAVTALSLVIYLCFQASVNTGGVVGLLTSTPISILFMLVFLSIMLVSHLTLSKYMNNKNLAVFNRSLKAEREVNYYMQQIMFDYEKGKVLRLYNMNEVINERFRQSNHFIREVYQEHFPMMYFEQGIQSLTGCVSLLFSYLFVVLKVAIGVISIGELTKYVGAINQLNAGMTQFIKSNDEIRLQCEYLKTFTSFMKLRNKRATGSIPVEKRLDNEYELAFHHVSFAYPGSSQMILKDVSCKINMKDKLAVVGRNGAGKTTFIKLITRLYDPTEGYITLNGIDIRKYDYNEYVGLFGVVFQDFSLFAFPIEQNVATHIEVDEKKVWEMLQFAGIKNRIEKMPHKLKTPLFKYDEDGVECSGGESQKIAIARALYKDAPFIILDEPTAALDPVSEYEIYSRFHELVKDKTSIYISHRMSSCRFCDEIMVFDAGRIVQRGPHERLMQETDNLYAKIWDAQASYYAS